MKDKMDCGFCREKLDQYIEGKLGKEEALSFESHLQTCPECREILDLQVLADRIITEEKKGMPGFYLPGRIMAGIGRVKREQDPLLIRLLRPALATISVAAAITGGVLLGSIPGRNATLGAPVELVLMNDADLEFVNDLAAE